LVDLSPMTSPDGTDAAGLAGAEARARWRTVLRRFLRHRGGAAGLALIAALLVFAFLGPLLWTKALSPDYPAALPPSAAYPFGTDRIGHDMLASVISGTLFSLRIALTVALVATLLGVVLGSLAGYLRGWVDAAISRFIDLLLCIPSLVVAAVLARHSFSLAPGARNGGNWLSVALVLALFTSWFPIARTMRAVVLSLREREYVEAARALGASTWRIVYRHILPNTVDVIIVNATVTVAQAVLLESALSFLGLGVHRPDASLGLLIDENKIELNTLPWLFWFPFLFIVLISLSVNFVGDGLRDAFDPRQRKVRT
jgi:peptide/nickel transport system permease protein